MSHEPTGKEIAEANFLKNRIFGDDLELDTSDPDADTNADIKAFFHAAEVANKIGKSSGASVVLDLPLPPVGDTEDESEGFWKAPRVVRYEPDALAKASRASDERFARLTVQLQRFFGDHTEEADEAVAICKRARDEERNAMIADIAR